jgi:tetratricopeptide (TPR) repeat protein
LPEAEASLREAARLALASGSDEIAAWAMADLAWNDGEGGRPESARRWVDLAHGLWSRLGEPAQLGVRVIGAEALAAIAAGAPADGLAATNRQIELARLAFGTDPLAEAANHKNLAHALMWNARNHEATTEIEQAIDQATAALGADHPMLAGYWLVAGEIAALDGRLPDGIADLRRSIELTTKWYGDDADSLIDELRMLGAMLVKHGEIDDGRAAIERALALAKQRGDGPSEKLGEALVNLGVAAFTTGDLAGATDLDARGLAMLEAALGSQHPRLSVPLVLAGYIGRARKDYASSTRDLQRAVAITSSALGDGHPDTINARLELARTLIAAGRAADAVDALDPGLAALAAGAEVPDAVAAEAQLVFADAAWRTGDRDRARAAALTARDRYAAAGADYAAARDGAEGWLRAHGGAP